MNESELIDLVDLNRDEFLRIKAICGNHPNDTRFQEIAQLCERSQQVIAQRVSVIQQRDDTLAALAAAEGERDEAKRLLGLQDGPYVFESGEYVGFYELLQQRDAALAELQALKGKPLPVPQTPQEHIEDVMKVGFNRGCG